MPQARQDLRRRGSRARPQRHPLPGGNACADAYNRLAADYEWMEPDEWHSGGAFLDRYAGVLAALPAGARILDCACGSGSAALALARRGFDVHCSDASPAMGSRARERASRVHVPFEVRMAEWADLPLVYAEPFDAVFCAGNSLAHALSEQELIRALRGICGVLRPGGTLTVDSRRRHRLPFRPFRARELERSLVAAGFDLLDWEWDETGESYMVVAERPAIVGRP